MTIKKLTALLCCSLLCSGLFGCSQSEVEQSAEEALIATNVEYLSTHELKNIATLTKDSILTAFGEDAQIITTGADVDFIMYGDSIDTAHTSAFVNKETGQVVNMTTTKNDIRHVRGIQIGDSYKSVIDKFTVSEDKPVVDMEGNGYKLLYGEDNFPEASYYGKVHYNNSKIRGVSYNVGKDRVYIQIEDNVVSSITYDFDTPLVVPHYGVPTF